MKSKKKDLLLSALVLSAVVASPSIVKADDLSIINPNYETGYPDTASPESYYGLNDSYYDSVEQPTYYENPQEIGSTVDEGDGSNLITGELVEESVDDSQNSSPIDDGLGVALDDGFAEDSESHGVENISPELPNNDEGSLESPEGGYVRFEKTPEEGSVKEPSEVVTEPGFEPSVGDDDEVEVEDLPKDEKDELVKEVEEELKNSDIVSEETPSGVSPKDYIIIENGSKAPESLDGLSVTYTVDLNDEADPSGGSSNLDLKGVRKVTVSTVVPETANDFSIIQVFDTGEEVPTVLESGTEGTTTLVLEPSTVYLSYYDEDLSSMVRNELLTLYLGNVESTEGITGETTEEGVVETPTEDTIEETTEEVVETPTGESTEEVVETPTGEPVSTVKEIEVDYTITYKNFESGNSRVVEGIEEVVSSSVATAKVTISVPSNYEGAIIYQRLNDGSNLGYPVSSNSNATIDLVPTPSTVVLIYTDPDTGNEVEKEFIKFYTVVVPEEPKEEPSVTPVPTDEPKEEPSTPTPTTSPQPTEQLKEEPATPTPTPSGDNTGGGVGGSDVVTPTPGDGGGSTVTPIEGGGAGSVDSGTTVTTIDGSGTTNPAVNPDGGIVTPVTPGTPEDTPKQEETKTPTTTNNNNSNTSTNALSDNPIGQNTTASAPSGIQDVTVGNESLYENSGSSRNVYTDGNTTTFTDNRNLDITVKIDSSVADLAKTEITLVGRRQGTLDSTKYVTSKSGVYKISDIAEDDYYTLTIKAYDRNGRLVTDTVENFSVNTKGSRYKFEDDTLGSVSYKSLDSDVVITETNVDKILTGKSVIKLYRGGKEISVDSGDIKITRSGGTKGDWKYSYSIPKKYFTEDGVYSIEVYSVSETGVKYNSSSRTLQIIIDNLPPKLSISGIRNNGRYKANSQRVTLSISDISRIKSVKAWLNGQEVGLNYDGSTGLYYYDVPSSTKSGTLRFEVEDDAGNISTEEVKSFIIDPELSFSSKFLYGAAIAGSTALLGLVGWLVFKRRKKLLEEDEIAMQQAILLKDSQNSNATLTESSPQTDSNPTGGKVEYEDDNWSDKEEVDTQTDWGIQPEEAFIATGVVDSKELVDTEEVLKPVTGESTEDVWSEFSDDVVTPADGTDLGATEYIGTVGDVSVRFGEKPLTSESVDDLFSTSKAETVNMLRGTSMVNEDGWSDEWVTPASESGSDFTGTTVISDEDVLSPEEEVKTTVIPEDDYDDSVVTPVGVSTTEGGTDVTTVTPEEEFDATTVISDEDDSTSNLTEVGFD